MAALVMLASACTSDNEPSLADPADTSALVEDTATTEAASEDVEATAPNDPTETMEIWASTLSGGAVVSIARNGGAVSTFAVGAADSSGSPLEPDSQFRVGSISKTFIAAMVMQLVDEGTLALDDPVAGFLSDASTGLDPALTVRQLMSHTSGVPSYTDQGSFFGAVFSDAERAWTPREIRALVDEIPADFEPGERHSYSNTNYVVLGQLLEALTGQTIDETLKERITEPLGLTLTTFDSETASPVVGYSTFLPGDSSEAESYTSIATSAWAAGELVSTGPELARFLQALVGGELMTESSFEAMTEGMQENGYGLGLFPIGFPTGMAIGHGGGIPGFTSIMGIQPETGDLLVVVSNDDFDDANELAQRVVRTW